MSAKKKRKSEYTDDNDDGDDDEVAVEKPRNWWAKSAARQRLLNDLLSGDLPLSAKELGPKAAWERYKNRPEFVSVMYDKFVTKLNDHRKQVQRDATGDGEVRPKNWWKDSAARQRLIDDLENGDLSLSEKEVSAAMAWDFYKTCPEFSNVAFEKFEGKLKDHRAQVAPQKGRSSLEMDALRHDRKLYPRVTHDSCGKSVWDLSRAKKLLRAYVKDKLATMTPADLKIYINPTDLWETREEYKVYDLQIFTHHIYQEIKLQKYFNYRNDKADKERQTKY
jgi:hypothetical protein